MTRTIAAPSPPPRSIRTTTTTDLKASRSKAVRPLSLCVAKFKCAMAYLLANRVADACFAANPNMERERRLMPVDDQAAIDLLKELRALTADENGAQRLAWSPVWLKARTWFQTKLKDLPVEHHLDAA